MPQVAADCGKLQKPAARAGAESEVEVEVEIEIEAIERKERGGTLSAHRLQNTNLSFLNLLPTAHMVDGHHDVFVAYCLGVKVHQRKNTLHDKADTQHRN